LIADIGVQIIFTGSEAEQELIDGIREQMAWPAYLLAGRPDLNQLGALLALAPVLIANNTGPVHIAAALGKPVVDLYALTNPQHTEFRTIIQVGQDGQYTVAPARLEERFGPPRRRRAELLPRHYDLAHSLSVRVSVVVRRLRRALRFRVLFF
jgi:ADP-heptose:LPS heptosyltransferase